MIDPELGMKVLDEYFTRTPDEQVLSDIRRFSPELAERLGLFDVKRRATPRCNVRGVLRRGMPARWISGGYYRRTYVARPFRFVWLSPNLHDLTSAG